MERRFIPCMYFTKDEFNKKNNKLIEEIKRDGINLK